MKEIKIENFTYFVEDDEFKKLYIEKYCNLDMYNDLYELEKLIGLINDICIDLHLNKILFINPTHGGYMPNSLCNDYKVDVLFSNDNFLNHLHNFMKNKEHYSNISLVDKFENDYDIIFCEEHIDDLKCTNPTFFLLSKEKYDNYNHHYNINSFNLYVPNNHYNLFFDNFYYYMNNGIFTYDNLIHLCIMVKNGGKQFKNILLKNLNLFDKWTILDTGSTDESISIINEVLSCKKGKLYREDFINFRDSRNRLLDLAGTQCKFTLMLDDTYTMEGNIRQFLNTVRSDQYSDSFTIYIKSYDVEYASNRILKSNRKLRYLYKIHEVINPENNTQIIIPIDDVYILDKNDEYMEKRTNERKSLDLKLLYEELEDDPNNPRTHYYLAQTYNFLENYELAYHWFNERVNHKNEGFHQEKVDAAFERARLANFKLNKEWELCEKMYKEAYELDKTRPDSLYFLGIHYYLNNDYKNAYIYFKEAFEVGYPLHTQYSLKPTISFHYLPKFLTFICYELNDYILGERSASLFLQKNKETDDDYNKVLDWFLIFQALNKCPKTKCIINHHEKPIFCFVADGNFHSWSGSSINKIGIGGSETYIIEMARYLQKNNIFQVYVFCNCDDVEDFEGVIYCPLSKYFDFMNTTKVHTCIVSRYPEYLPVAYYGFCENVFLSLHDVSRSGIIVMHPKLKNVFCLSEWHVQEFTTKYPQLKNITLPFYYGINEIGSEKQKIPYKFIYSSFPNRGLLPLLEMWPTIYQRQPLSSLHIYSDLDGAYVNSVSSQMMIKIKTILSKISYMNIFYYGWVDKSTLYESWKTADIWLYPCIFEETFCLTALEAAISKTLVITNNLAGLQTTVNDRGIVIPGEVNEVWKQKVIHEIFVYFDNRNHIIFKNIIDKNYYWASNFNWDKRAKILQNFIIKNYGNSLHEYKSFKKFTLQNNNDLLDGLKVFSNLLKNNNNNKIKLLQIGNTTLPITYFFKLFNNYEGLIIYDWENTERNDDFSEFTSQNKLKTINGSTLTILKLMMLNKEIYEFIYINFNEYCINEFFVILFISCQLLNNNGVILITYDDIKNIHNFYSNIKKFINKEKYMKCIIKNNIIMIFKVLL